MSAHNDVGQVVVRLRYLGGFRSLVGVRDEVVVLDKPARVRDVLNCLVERHGECLKQVLFNQYGWLDPRCFFLVDCDDGVIERDLDARIETDEQARLVLGMAMSGG